MWYVIDQRPRLTDVQRYGAALRAAAHGDAEVLRFARRAGCRVDVQLCNEAARGGHLAALQWARDAGCP
jgi:hypothetical protein